jgi:predicted heme/steroid binding protein/uncharacterized membrane protein
MPHRLPFLLTTALLLIGAVAAHATPDFAERTGQPCRACHLADDGGALNATGAAYRATGVWPPAPAAAAPYLPLSPAVVPFVRLAHLIFGFLWFGTILYVHLLLRPAYAAKGLPTGEMRLGIASMIVVGASGLLLTLTATGDMAALPATHWGRMLTAKAIVYLVMITSAAVVVIWLRPRLRSTKAYRRPPADGLFDAVTLTAFDGKEGRPAYIAYNGAVYDVTASRLWREGKHMKRHFAGYDLTGALDQAPHGGEKLDDLPVVGAYDPDRPAPLTGPQRLFYAIAYMNLGLVFATLAILAFW